jgi:hypothetical protein
MKLKLFLFISLLFCFSAFLQAQTAGNLTFNFTQGAPIDLSAEGGCVMAVWIQSGTTFTKTNLRYLGDGTRDHLPTYGAKAGWTTVNNALTANAVDAVTGATRKSGTNPAALGSYSVSWNGTNVGGTVTADGTYTVWYEVTWEDIRNGSNFINSGFAFTKGASISTTTPANEGPLSAMTLTWTPSALSLDSVYKTKVALYPNPSSGIIKVVFNDIPVNNIDVVNILGQVVKSIKLDPSKSRTSESIDLSGNAKGLYIINISTNETSSSYKVVLDK